MALDRDRQYQKSAPNGDAAEASGAKLNLTTGRDRFASSGLLGGKDMNRIKNTAEVTTYNEPGKPSIRIHSHWNRSEMVEIQVGEERFIVVGDDLKKAIDNCMNVK